MERLFATPMMSPRLPFMSPSNAMSTAPVARNRDGLARKTKKFKRNPVDVRRTVDGPRAPIHNSSNKHNSSGESIMGYAGERIMCDADSHIMETFDWLKDHADPELRDLIPSLKLGGAGRLAEKAIENALVRRQDPSKAAELRANIIGGAKGWGAYGAFDPVERREAPDDLGFRRQIVFPTFAPTQFLGEKDAKLKYGGARGHNRAMGEFFSGGQRMMGVPCVPLHAPELAAVEIANAAK